MTRHEAAAALRATFARLRHREPGEYPPRILAGMRVVWAHTPQGVLSGGRIEDQPAAVQASVAELVEAVLHETDHYHR